jgi:hypothetical protein
VLVVAAPAPAFVVEAVTIFLFVLLADRDGERAVRVLLEERREARGDC